MKVIALLMLLSLIAEELAMPCSRLAQPENCINHPRIRVTKTSSHYRLSLCSNNPDCLPSRNQDSEWFECKDLCDVCRSLPGTPSCANHQACEAQVDAYLNSYCESAIPSTATINSGPTTTITVIEPSLTRTQTETITSISYMTVTNAGETVTSTVTCNPSVGVSQGIPASANSTMAQSSREHKSVLALGALLALTVIILLTVITGWVWTCSVMKKREIKNGNLDRMRFDVNKFVKNHTYETNDISTKECKPKDPLTPEQQKFQKNKYDRIVVVPSLTRNGQKYDVLNRQPTFTGADIANPPSNESLQEGSTTESQQVCPRQYNQLGCRDKQLENYCTTRLVE